MSRSYIYDAFISYRHTTLDKAVAERLQRLLEGYVPPKSMDNSRKFEKWRIFRDETELPTSSDLGGDIKTALENSKYLIVVCSNTTRHSRWCMEEINYFKSLHGGSTKNIITLIAEGEPSEVFPPELCCEEVTQSGQGGEAVYSKRIVEPLAASVAAPTQKESLKKLKTEFLRIAAPMLGCGFDTLYNRSQRRHNRRILTTAAAIVAAMTVLTTYSSAMLIKINNQNLQLEEKTAQLNESNSTLSQKNDELDRTNTELDDTNKTLENTNADLEKKTKEAQDNLSEANRQRNAANKNLTEANTQRKKAEDNLTEANRQKKIAENNLAEANRQQKAAQENSEKANRQQKIAEDNANEAERQREIALANAKEANEQRAAAQENEKEANRQRETAEQNMRVAVENENRANAANKSLRIKNSEILTEQANLYLKNAETKKAIETALAAMPEDENDDMPINPSTERVLAAATGAYSTEPTVINSMFTASAYVNFVEFSDDGSRIVASDTVGNIYLIDYDKQELIRTFSATEVFGKKSNIGLDIILNGSAAYAGNGKKFIAFDLSDGTITAQKDVGWSYNYDKFSVGDAADIVFVSSYWDFICFNKSGGVIATGDDFNIKVNTDKSECIVSDDGNVYVISPDDGKIFKINPYAKTAAEYPIDIKADDKILSVYESGDCIYINASDGEEKLVSDNGYDYKIICEDKKSMSEKWRTDYHCDNSQTFGLNEMFTMTHKMNEKEYKLGETQNMLKKSGVIVITRNEILAFDIQSGEKYVQTQFDEPALYAWHKPNTSWFSVATENKIGLQCVIISPETYVTVGLFTNQNAMEYIAFCDDYKIAYAGKNSPNISVYHKADSGNYKILNDIEHKYSSQFCALDSGMFGLYYTEYSKDDSKTKQDYFVIYDTEKEKTAAKLGCDISVRLVETDGDRFILCGTDKQYNSFVEIIGKDGTVTNKINMSDGYKECFGDVWVSSSDVKVGIRDNKVRLYNKIGIIEKDLNEYEWKIVYKPTETVGDFSVGESSAAYVIKGDDSAAIGYIENDSYDMNYVKSGGETARFENSEIQKICTSRDGETAAFVSANGFVGIYKSGGDDYNKIVFNKNEISPTDMTFVPNGDAVIVLCANGDIIRFDLNSMQIGGKYSSSETVQSYSRIEFIDDKTFAVKSYGDGYSNKTQLIDSDYMQVKAETENLKVFIKNDKKMIAEAYLDGERRYVMFDYLSGFDLIDFAKRTKEKF